MKVVGLVSGGKDSCFAMMRCIDYGHEIVALANLMPLDDSVDELDSYMYQTVGHQIIVGYAECMGVPLFRRRIRGSTRHHDLNYKVTPGDEVEDLVVLLNEVKQQIPSITAVSSGAIASDYQRLRVESVCSRLGLVSLAYLWKQDQTFLLEEMIRRGIVAIIVKVAAMGLVPAKHLGRELADLHPHLLQLKELYGVNVCGEGGEYETLTLDCPLFTKARIALDKFQMVMHSPDSIAPVGILHPSVFHLEHKNKAPSYSSDYRNVDIFLEKTGHVYEVEGDIQESYLGRCQHISSVVDFGNIAKLKLGISKPKRDTYSICCWLQGSSGTIAGLQEDMITVLKKIEEQLRQDSFDWVNVLYVHLYISDMKQFALANEIYVRFITEKKCSFGVPSRSTIELPLMQAGLGNAYVEVLVASDQSKKVLHVQSISCWAPSCIGPYSQATLHKEVLYMAGQLGLDPPTMMLRPGGSANELEQALENCEAVANCFSSSIYSSTILFVIYCSATLKSSEMAEIQHKMENIFNQEVSGLPNAGLTRPLKPVFLYMLAPNLPKGSLVELKPVLHIPEDGQERLQSDVRPTTGTRIPKHWGFDHLQWKDSCCQKYIVHRKICLALLSVTNDVATRICTQIDQGAANIQFNDSNRHVKALMLFCVYLADTILLENDFSWENLTNLRFYVSIDRFPDVEMLSRILSEVFGEFVDAIADTEVVKEQKFSLIPVLASGGSACMDDIITCELFAVQL